MKSEQDLLHAVQGLEPLVYAHALAGRRLRRMPVEVIAAMHEQELFRLWIPGRYGGLEVSLPAALSLYRAAAVIDGSFGWSLMIGAGGGLFAAHLAPSVAEAVFRPRTALVAGSGAVDGTAERVSGGYRAAGRWRYASGAHHATVFTANCRILGRDPSAPGTSGAVVIRALAFAPEDVTLHDDWDTTGLRATGSHSMQVRSALVPEERSFTIAEDRPVVDAPLYRVPFGVLTELPVASVALGLAERSLAEFRALASGKPVARLGRSLGQIDRVREAEEAAECAIRDGHRELFERAEEIWRAITEDGALAPILQRRSTQSAVSVARRLVAATGALVPFAGMNAIRTDDPFAVAWRDLEAVTAHVSLSPLACD